MMRRIAGYLMALVLGAFLAACGGGGSESGSCLLCGGGSSGTDATYAVTVEVQRSGTKTSSVSSSETVKAVATVVDDGGDPVAGVVVTFSEDGAGLLRFAPTSATALTDESGVASIDIAASDSTVTGATSVAAAVSIDGTAYSGAASFAIKAGSTDVAATPAAINYVSTSPSDVSIVIKGAGGTGRTESATLTFKVVDVNNSPIEGATVNFTASPSSAVTLNVSSAVSDSSGLVVTTVQSKTVATSVVIKATAVADASVYGMSDTLVISTGVAVAGGFEIVADKYNLDGRLTGDSAVVSAYVRDANGNPVADGVAVSFTTDFGVIGSSSKGACTTTDGTCSVTFKVQNPRGDGLATVVGKVTLPSDEVLTEAINVNMSGATGGLIATDESAVELTAFVIPAGTCSSTQTFLLQDAEGRSAPAGTTVKVDAVSSNVSASVTSGSPVLDSLSFEPTSFTVAVDASSEDLLPVCSSGGTVQVGGFVTLSFTTPGNIKYVQRLSLSYPQN